MAGVLRGAGWNPAWVMGTMAAVGLAFGLLTLERDGRIEGLRKPKDGSALPLGWVPVIGGGIVLIAFMTENAAENWSALHIEKTLGGSPEEGALGPAMLALTMGFARLGGQWLAGRMDPFTILRIGAVVASVGAVQLLCLGVLGEYVGRMYTMLQRRPTYYVAHDTLAGEADVEEPADPGGRRSSERG